MLQLLIVPFILAIGGFWLNQIQKRREEQTTEQRAELERELTHNNQQEALLQSYIDKMSEPLLHEKLRSSAEEDEVRKIARVQTLTGLSRLDAKRKGSILQFLYESEMINKMKPIVNLQGADLSRVYLFHPDLRKAFLFRAVLSNAPAGGAIFVRASLEEASLEETLLAEADLSGANLTKANLNGAGLADASLVGANLTNARLVRAILMRSDLTGADFTEADLSGANLSGARVTQEQLSKAKSLEGATMPDGSIHP